MLAEVRGADQSLTYRIAPVDAIAHTPTLRIRWIIEHPLVVFEAIKSFKSIRGCPNFGKIG
jgi:hypothetical protein